MKVSIRAIEDLWFYPGTASDAATAANNYCDRSNKTWTGEKVREIWAKAISEGRLPDLMRPLEGFKGDALVVVQKLKAGRVSA